MTNPIETAPQSLFQSERQREIVALTLQDSRVEVADLADRFGVTTETIRRDLSDLQRQRVVRRVHGGAVPWEVSRFEPLLSVRSDQQDAEKRSIARLALDELPPAGTVLVDSGSTLTRFGEALTSELELRVLTNSLPTAQALAENGSIEVVVIGGKVVKNTMAMVDAEAVAAVEAVTVDALFISCDGLSPANGLSTPYRDEAALKQAMIRSARRVVVLADHSKFGHDHFKRFAEWSDVDVLITDRGADQAMVTEIEARGTSVRVA
ncbi:MAG: DeoR/GlpR family DNA-binding transcription regulator [Actinomycetota bacterium]